MRWTRELRLTCVAQAYGEVVWFGRRGAGVKLAIRSAGDGGKRAVLREEHEVSRKAIAQGRPECSRCPVCSCAFSIAQIARETAGAARTRSSLPPLNGEGQRNAKLRAQRAARSQIHIQRSATANSLFPNLYWTWSRKPGTAAARHLCDGLLTKLADSYLDYQGRTECRILRCSNAGKVAPANGQWQFAPLLCIGATGIQASEPDAHSEKNKREETCGN
jgi:hypothetical protein